MMRSRRSKRKFAAVSGAALMLAMSAPAADLIPESFPRCRYLETLAQSPFALAVETPVPSKPQRPLTAYLTGLGKLNDGRDWVAVRFAEHSGTHTFIGSDPGKSGASVAEVNWGGTWKDTKAVINSGGERIEIKFRPVSTPIAPPTEPHPKTGKPRKSGSGPQFQPEHPRPVK